MPPQRDYETARQIALDTLSNLELEKCCPDAGLSLALVPPGTKQVRIPYIDHTYTLTVQNNSFFR